MRIPFEELKAQFNRILSGLNFTRQDAEACADIFANNSLDGVYTHGLNRFPVFVQYVKEGLVKPGQTPELLENMGAIERWDGNLAPGMLNARFCMDRAMQLAAEYGMGCVAIRNTNHWMRGGTYGWQAAGAGYIGINFTNTTALIPPWGGTEPRLGNNPLVIAVPRKAGHVVLDMAISQYSNGKLMQYDAAGDKLPVPGGYDSNGKLTDVPAEILQSQRALPIGFWKGAGLTLMLDLLATALSKGRSTAEITKGKESGVSQVFIAIKPGDDGLDEYLIEQIIDYTRTSATEGDTQIRYPGEGTLLTRMRNLKEGIPVDIKIWEQVLTM